MTTPLLEFEVRKAVLAKLTTDLAALSPPVPVVDHPAANQAYPYVTLDRVLGRPQDLIADDYTNFLFYFSIWSTKRGHREAQLIAGAARNALHRAELTSAAGNIVEIRVTRTDITRDGDGVTYTGSLEVEVVAEH